MNRSSRGRWQRVVDARIQSRSALGRDPWSDGLFDSAPKPRSKAAHYISPPPAASPRLSESVYVLTLGEAAARLRLSRRELEAMIDAGKINGLPTGYTRTIPTSEVERLTQSS